MNNDKIKVYIKYFVQLFGIFAVVAGLSVFFTGTFDPFSTMFFSLALTIFINIAFMYRRAFKIRKQRREEMIKNGTWKKK